MTPLRKRMMEELQLRNLSPVTADTYLRVVERFARHFDQSPDRLGLEQVREYLLHLLRETKVVASTVMVNRAALKFLYAAVLKQKWFDAEIACPKRRPTLPGILSPDEITSILDHTHNLKHWTIIATLYATGLRANELRHLKVSDIDGKRMVVMCAKARVECHGTSLCPQCCGSAYASIFGGAGRPIGYSLPNSVRINRSIWLRFVICAAMPESEPVFLAGFIRTCSGMPAPLTCSMAAPIYVPSRRCLGIPISGPPQSIFACPCNGCRLSAAPSTRCN